MNMEIFEMLCKDDSFASPNAEELRRELELEMLKPTPDIALIDELVRSIMEIEDIPQPDIDIEAEYRKIAARRRKGIHLRTLKIAAAAACTVLLISNIASYKVYGKNIFSAVVTRFSSMLTFDFKSVDDPSADHTDKYDKYGIKKLFEEHGYYVEVPMYIPEGFEIRELREAEDIRLDLDRGNEYICLSFFSADNEKYSGKFSIQDGITEYEKITVNGHDGYYVRGENGDWLTYRFGDTIAIHSFSDMERSEIEKIIKSIK